jgi:hypothetical protein
LAGSPLTKTAISSDDVYVHAYEYVHVDVTEKDEIMYRERLQGRKR